MTGKTDWELLRENKKTGLTHIWNGAASSGIFCLFSKKIIKEYTEEDKSNKHFFFLNNKLHEE